MTGKSPKMPVQIVKWCGNPEKRMGIVVTIGWIITR